MEGEDKQPRAGVGRRKEERKGGTGSLDQILHHYLLLRTNNIFLCYTYYVQYEYITNLEILLPAAITIPKKKTLRDLFTSCLPTPLPSICKVEEGKGERGRGGGGEGVRKRQRQVLKGVEGKDF